MKSEAMAFHLKDGRPAILRCPERKDAQELIDFLETTAAETEFLLALPGERGLTVEMEERFLDSMGESPYDMMLLCEVDGKIAGNCHLMLNRQKKIAHRARIAIALYRAFWGNGIGTAMFGQMIAIARNLGLMQLELEYIEGNERGKALYKKMGFKIVAEHPDAYRMADGSLRKEIVMIKKL